MTNDDFMCDKDRKYKKWDHSNYPSRSLTHDCNFFFFMDVPYVIHSMYVYVLMNNSIFFY